MKVSDEAGERRLRGSGEGDFALKLALDVTLALALTRAVVDFLVLPTPMVDVGGDRTRVMGEDKDLRGDGGRLWFEGLSGWGVCELEVLRNALLLTLALGRMRGVKAFVGEAGGDVGCVLFREDGLEETEDTSR